MKLIHLIYIIVVFIPNFVTGSDIDILKSSLTFVIDDTGSMAKEIEAVKDGAKAIFDQVVSHNESQVENYKLVTFNDMDVEYLGIIDKGIEVRAETKDHYAFKQAISNIYVHGGGLCPEYALSGIKKALEISLPRSDLYVFTDASAKDYEDFEEIKSLAQKKQSRIVFVLTGVCSSYGGTNDERYKVYQKIASATDGEVFNIMKREVSKVLEYVKKVITGRRTTLATKTLPSGKHNFTFDADTIMGELTISLSANKADDPKVDITAPDGSDVWKKIIFETDKVKVYSVDVTKPGTHTVKLENKAETHAKVSAKSGVDFRHGFSKFKLSSIVDTSSRPAPGVKSHLSIKLNKGDIELKAIQILDMADNVITELPLLTINKGTKLYTTKAFDPPDTMFNVMIIGYDPKTNSTITRKASTPVEPQKPPKEKEIENKKPTVTIEGAPIISATQGKPIQLVCKINGYPKPDVIWMNKNTNKPETGDVSVLELPYDYLNVLSIAAVRDNTTYGCKAINSLGADEIQVALNVSIENKFIVIDTPKRVSVDYGKEVKIQCIVDAIPPADITWIRRRKILKSNDNIEISSNKSTLTIKRATHYDKGTYSCDIRNKNERKLFNKVVKVISEAPKIDDRTPRNVTVKIGSSVDLECRIVKGLPKPSISWIYSYGDTSAERVEKPEWRNKEVVAIKYANRLDSGKYTCLADNEIYGDSRDIDVLVEYAPSVEIRRKLIKAKTGDIVQINCIIYGGPKPKVVWYKDGVKLESYDRSSIYGKNMLRFEAHLSDSGVYKCTAINSIGTAFEEVRVEISSPPVITPPTKSRYIILKDGGTILPCQANGDPKPRIQWVFYSDKTNTFPKISFETKKTGELVLKKVQIQDEGYYTCIASNAAGSTNVTYPVVVYEPAKITNKLRDNHFVAVEGDTVLRLTCEVTGNPKPKISWTKDDQLLASGSSQYIKDGVLEIRDVPKAAQGKYQCYAENAIGHDYVDYFVLVNSYPPSTNVTSTHVMVEKEKPARLECPLRHRNIDELRWYKNGKLITKGELTITRVSVSDVGLYTCRVSDTYRAESANVKVDVGIPPEFRTEEESDVDMVSDVNLSCENVGVPSPSVTWYKNGRRIDWTESDYFIEMSSSSVGQYRCDVQNVFGIISRTFNLVPHHCYIDTQKLTKLQPIMIGPDEHWPRSLSRGHIIEFNRDEQLVLVCPNKFQKFASKYVYAFCAGGTNVKINGNLYDYSDIQCTEEVKHIVKKTGEKCMPGDTEKLRITYKELADYGEEEAYEICWNKAEQSPIYARHILSPESMADSDYEALWSNGDELNMNYTEAYDCEGQINRISAVRGERFHADDRCCFSQRQLVNPKDVFPGIPQKATFSYYNVVPQWSSCNSENWDAIEDRVRNFAKDSLSGSDLIVWTGTAKKVSLPTKHSAPKDINSFFMDQRANMQPVPMFLWKVIQDPSSRQSIAIVQINIPDLRPSDVHKHVLCSDVCYITVWMQNPAWHDVKKGYTYCCNIEEFEHKFEYRGIFEPGMEYLLENHSLPEPGGLVV